MIIKFLKGGEKMKKIILFGLVFLAMTLIASPALGVSDNRRDRDHIGNFNFVIEPKNRGEARHDMSMAAVRNIRMAIDNSEPGDNVGVLLRGISKDELKSLVADGFVRGDSFFDVFVEIEIGELKSLIGKPLAGKVLVEPHPAESKKSLRADDRTYDYEVWNQPIK